MSGRLSRAALVLGFAFLYLPIAVLAVYSFNASRLVTVWAGFSTRWYGELLRDRQMLEAAWLSLRIAAATATAALALGTLAGLALVRAGRVRGRMLLGAMVTAPLVMPEVITGLSLLLLYVAMKQLLGWPAERGFLTVWLAHTTFATAFVTIVIAARLAEFDPALEEAAMDLGARPLRTFFAITLPVISPALLAGWLLAFSLSLDDVVISSFATGPKATTLPILIFSSVRLGVSPKINALATILVAIVGLGAVVSWLGSRRSQAA